MQTPWLDLCSAPSPGTVAAPGERFRIFLWLVCCPDKDIDGSCSVLPERGRMAAATLPPFCPHRQLPGRGQLFLQLRPCLVTGTQQGLHLGKLRPGQFWSGALRGFWATSVSKRETPLVSLSSGH